MPSNESVARAQQQSLGMLRWQWLGVAVVYLGAIVVAHNALPVAWRAADTRLWMAMALGVASVQLAILWWALPFNHAPNPASASAAVPHGWLGIANCLTLTRGMLVALLAGFIFAPMPWGWMAWIPAILYGTERAVDLFDGYVARVTHHQSRLGGILDMEYDGLGLLIASAVAIQYGKIPAWYLLLGLARPLFVLGLYVRQRLGWRVLPLAPSDLRRIVAGVQTGLVAVVLAPVIPAALTWFASCVFAIPLIFSFVRDWLVVSNTLDNDNRTYQQIRLGAKRVMERWIPPLARWSAGAIALALALSPTWGAGRVTVVAALLCAVGLLLGVLGRVAAAFLFAVVASDVALFGLLPRDMLMVIAIAIVTHFGSGPLALWPADERIFRAPLGAHLEESGAQKRQSENALS